MDVQHHIRMPLLVCALVSLGSVLGVGGTAGGQADYDTGSILQSSKPTLLDGFGFSVSIDGGQVLVGSPHAAGMRGQTGKVFLVQQDSGKLLREFVVPSPMGDDLFGLSVNLTPDYVIVGAPRGQGRMRRSVGSVSIFERGSGNLGRVVHSTNTTVAAFGHAIASQGNVLAIGDPGASTSTNPDGGEAYLVDVSHGEVLQKFSPPKGKQGKPDGFGHSLVFLGEQLAVGAPMSGGIPVDAGEVFLFDYQTGQLKATLQSPDPQTDEYFGWALAGDDELLIVGALGRGTVQAEAGAVYVFARGGQLVHILEAPEPQKGDHFGEAVALLDEYIVVAAPGDDAAGVDAGAVYVFDRSTKVLQFKISNPSATTGVADLFGLSLSGSGHSLVVGAPYGDLPTMPDAGLVHQFTFYGTEQGAPVRKVPSQQR